MRKIYIKLLNEGTDVWKPVEAFEISANIYRIAETNEYDKSDEQWEFLPGTTVECQWEQRGGENVLFAYRAKKLGHIDV